MEENPWSYSRQFNPWRYPRSNNAHKVVSEVIERFLEIENKRGLRSRSRKTKDLWNFRITIETLICDLAHHYLSGHTKGLAISRSNRHLRKTSRYKNPHLNSKLPYVLDVLEWPELQILEQVKGGLNYFDTEKKGSYRTVMSPGRGLVELIKRHQIEFEDLGSHNGVETIILKREKNSIWDNSEALEYEDTDLTKHYRYEMTQINQWINEAELNYLMPINSKYDVDLSERRLKRYFTRESFESGGRLFGGFWLNMKKEQRKNILIDGEEAVSLDYSQMSPRILYGICGCVPDTEDCYGIKGYGSSRSGIKKVFNAMTFVDKPMTRFPKGVNQLFKKGTRFLEVSVAIQRAHSGIAQRFYCGIGHYLQFIESQILIKVLLGLRNLGIHALPIHDAVLVGRTWVDMSRQLMEQVFLDMTNVDSCVQVE